MYRELIQSRSRTMVLWLESRLDIRRAVAGIDAATHLPSMKAGTEKRENGKGVGGPNWG